MDKLTREYWKEKVCFAQGHLTGLLSVRIGGEHYLIDPRNDPTEGGMMRGYGGRHFRLEFSDGRVVDTWNLWHQGAIPEEFRNELPDNAKFVDTEGLNLPLGLRIRFIPELAEKHGLRTIESFLGD